MSDLSKLLMKVNSTKLEREEFLQKGCTPGGGCPCGCVRCGFCYG